MKKEENVAVEERDKVIVRTSTTGIVANAFLAAFKAIVGITSNSIAVTLDAVNNLSDALSSVITIIGAKLAKKSPDREHPLGYGRIEYLSAMVVSAIVLYAGITSAVESVKKIINPSLPNYSLISLTIIAVAVVVKIFLGLYVKGRGKAVSSGALTASGQDALNDAILSGSVLACALIFKFTNVSLEAYVGLILSIFIIKAGLEMLKDTLGDILGRRPDKDLVIAIKNDIKAEPGVNGAYDLVLHNYGPDFYTGSVHIEVNEDVTAKELDRIERNIQHKIFNHYPVLLTGISIYALNIGDKEIVEMREHIRELVTKHDWALQIHGFYADLDNKLISFDTVISFKIERAEALKILHEELEKEYPGYKITINPDIDISEI